MDIKKGFNENAETLARLVPFQVNLSNFLEDFQFVKDMYQNLYLCKNETLTAMTVREFRDAPAKDFKDGGGRKQ